MSDTTEDFVRAGSFRESWRDRFQNKWPAMTTMMMRSESEIEYPNITPCPDFGIKNPSIRSWGSNPDTWTADSRGGEITDEESSSRVTKGDKRCEKLCRGVLCVFLILSVLAVAFAGIGLSLLLTQPEFGVAGKTFKDSYLDAGLDEPEKKALSDKFCDLVIKMLNDSKFPIDRGIHSCDAVLKYTKGLEGLHIDIDVEPTEGYTLKEKFLRSLRKIATKRKEDERAEANTEENVKDIQRNIFENTGLIFPKTGGFIEFLPDIWKSSSGNKSGDTTTDNTTDSNQPNTTTVDVNDESDQVKNNVSSIKESMNEKEEKERGGKMTQNGTTDTTEAIFEQETKSTKNVFVNMNKTGIKQKSNESVSNETKYTQEVKTGFTDEQMLSPPNNTIEENRVLTSSSVNVSTIRSPKFTEPTVNETLPMEENDLDKVSTTIMYGLLSYKKDGVTSPSNTYTSHFETTIAEDTTPTTSISLNTATVEFENETKINTFNDISTLPSSTSNDIIDDLVITTSTLKTVMPETVESTEPTFNTKEANRAAAIKSVKLFEINNMGSTSGVVLNASKTLTKGQRDFVAESLMSGGFMRLPMKTTSNFKFLFSSGSHTNKKPDNDNARVTSTVVVKERTNVEKTKI